jgi:hypothetical protein
LFVPVMQLMASLGAKSTVLRTVSWGMVGLLVLVNFGVMFAGLDVIGDYMTEVNVTSPTGIREIMKMAGVDLAAELMERIEQELNARRAAA